MQSSRKNRFDIFGDIINGYPSKVYQKSLPMNVKKQRSIGLDPMSIVGGIINGYPAKVYKCPAL
ncbi:MAG: hypothetical protein HOM11_15450 [Methylococcales bacterium]|jgi:hypothetical protein|nr:hypothetical protein [Methylococcales bacterium]MBT7445557.1 hypothetical protein [Methylococcales bacterium]